jgi:hypothetical protein
MKHNSDKYNGARYRRHTRFRRYSSAWNVRTCLYKEPRLKYPCFLSYLIDLWCHHRPTFFEYISLLLFGTVLPARIVGQNGGYAELIGNRNLNEIWDKSYYPNFVRRGMRMQYIMRDGIQKSLLVS